MSFQRLKSFSVVAAAAIGAAGTSSLAVADVPRTLQEFVNDSDLVFRGVVQNIEYALSRPSGPEQARIPYTFVTYRVEDALYGFPGGGTVTLRFIGGLDLKSKRYMSASHTPQFDLGDEDLLFVRDNNISMSPLVGHRDGRFRVIDGQIYTETGQAMTIDRDGAVLIGHRHLLEETMTTHVRDRVFVQGFGPDTIDGPSDAMLVDELLPRIAAAVLQAPAPERAFVSADPSAPFNGPDMTPARPPQGKPGESVQAADDESSEIDRPVKSDR